MKITGQTITRDRFLEVALIAFVWVVIFALGMILHKPGALVATRTIIAMWWIFAFSDSILCFYEPRISDKGMGQREVAINRNTIRFSLAVICFVTIVGFKADWFIVGVLYLAICTELSVYFERRLKARESYIYRHLDRLFKLNGCDPLPRGLKETIFRYTSRVVEREELWASFHEGDMIEAKRLRKKLQELLVK